MIKGINRYSGILTVIMFFLSCKSNVVFTDSVAMPGKKWDLGNVTEFSVPVTDTLNGNDVFFTIRTGTSYPYRNIYLFVTTISPQGKSITDTLQYMLADEKGRWTGKGFGDIHELNLPYRSNVFFPVSGIYKFKIQHGMRSEVLKGVYDFGLRIEKKGKQGTKSGEK